MVRSGVTIRLVDTAKVSTWRGPDVRSATAGGPARRRTCSVDLFMNTTLRFCFRQYEHSLLVLAFNETIYNETINFKWGSISAGQLMKIAQHKIAHGLLTQAFCKTDKLFYSLILQVGVTGYESDTRQNTQQVD